MAYSVNNSATTHAIRYSARDVGGGNFDFSQGRYYCYVDLTGSGFTAGGISTVDLITNVTAVAGGGITGKFWSSNTSDNFGTTLEATSGDFASGKVNNEGTLTMTSTGTKTKSINKNNIDYNNKFYIMIMDDSEGAAPHTATSATINSANASSNKPILRITTTSGAVEDFILTGYIPTAAAGSVTDYNPDTSDGLITKTYTSSSYDVTE